jgi:N-formylmaleamate deformylase
MSLHRLASLLLLSSACAALAPRPAGPPLPFHVEVVGQGRPILLIPGLSTSGEVWSEVVAHYRGRYQCHVLTLAGFAGQPALGEPLLPAVHEALARYVVEQHLERPVVVGHSLGGFVALWLAQTHPELVGELVLVDSVPSLAALQDPAATELSATQAADAFRARLRTITPEERAVLTRMSARSLVTAPAQVERVAGWGRQSDPDTVADAMYYVMTHDLRPGLTQVRAPALVVGTWVGSKGYASRQEVLDRFTAQYQACRTCRVVLDDVARHFVMLDDPQGLLARMDGFLQVPPTSGRVVQVP